MYTPEQQAENRKKLVAALRSGEFTQGTRVLTLRTEEGDLDCCLGVACKLYMKEYELQRDVKGIEYTTWDKLIKKYPQSKVVVYNRTYGVLPPNVREWLGFKGGTGELKGDPTDCLAKRNDRGGTFAEIADLIEQDRVALQND